MQWFSRDNKTIVPKDVADKSVLDFVPVRFDLGTPKQAMDYLAEKRKGSDFRMNDAVRVQTGVDEVEKVSEEEKIESAALDKLKDVQEAAYQQAYQLGLEEGRKKAFDEWSQSIGERMESLDGLLVSIKNLKTDMCAFNEAHLLQLAFRMASRLAKTELEQNNEGLLNVLRDSVALAQENEDVTVQVSPEQFDFVELLKAENGRELEFLKKIKFQPNPDIRVGGCIVETNYGEIDASIEQRVEQMWTLLAEALPRVKDRVAG